MVATVVRSHGIKGQLKVRVETDNPKRFLPGESLLLTLEGRIQEVTVEGFVPQNRYGIIKLTEVSSLEEADRWRGADLAIPASRLRHLEPGRYYTFQLLGLAVVSPQGQHLGTISQIEETPSGDIYLVKDESGGFYVPARGDIIQRIDLERGVMEIRDVEGLR